MILLANERNELDASVVFVYGKLQSKTHRFTDNYEFSKFGTLLDRSNFPNKDSTFIFQVKCRGSKAFEIKIMEMNLSLF